MRRRRVLLRLAAAAAAVALVWCGVLYAVIAGFRGMPDAGPPPHADVGIVLGASLWNGVPSPGLAERLDQALKLYRKGAFGRIIVSGGLDRGETRTEAEGMRDYLVGRGVPAAAVVLEPKSRNTYENLAFSQKIMEQRGWTTAIIVTHQYHGARAADIARTLGYDPVLVSVTESRVLNLAYNRSREVLAYTKWLALKLMLHWGWIAGID